MGRSLYGMLHRRYGRRPTGAERRRHSSEFHERLRASIPIGVMEARPAVGAPRARVAIVGAGFAGCAAAAVLKTALGWDVTVYDPTGIAGGRVSSSTTLVPGRILETGGELIGLNHPVWIYLANLYQTALGVVTPDDDYAGVGLNEPLLLHGKEAEALYDAMTPVMDAWGKAAAVVPNPFIPWTTPGAAALDAQSLAANVPAGTAPEVAYAVGLEFELNNTVPMAGQSWLANLAAFQAGTAPQSGGTLNFFDYTEVFRSTAGNQALAWALLGGTPVVAETVTAIDTQGGVTLTFQSGSQSPAFDYVVVATSVDAWGTIRVDGGAFPYAPVQAGPAIKYLAPVAERFWIADKLAPSSMSDALGMTWEGTDNQAATAGYELTVFAGGSLATQALEAGGTDAYFAPRIQAMYPGFSTSGGTFVDKGPSVLRGYSSPAPGQVTGAQQSYQAPYNARLAVAGEHTSAAWWGYMEGALESGVLAAIRLGVLGSAPFKSEWGGTAAV